MIELWDDESAGGADDHDEPMEWFEGDCFENGLSGWEIEDDAVGKEGDGDGGDEVFVFALFADEGEEEFEHYGLGEDEGAGVGWRVEVGGDYAGLLVEVEAVNVDEDVDADLDDGGDNDEAKEFVEDVFFFGMRFLLHDVWRGGGAAEGECGERVGGDIEPKDLEGEDWQWIVADGDDGDKEDGDEVSRKHVFDEGEDVVVNPAAFFNGGDDGGEVVVFEDDVGDFFGGFCSFDTHGYANIGVF